MAENTRPQGEERALEPSEMERDLAEFMQDQRSETSAILSLMERMTKQDNPSGVYVTSYPACNSEP